MAMDQEEECWEERKERRNEYLPVALGIGAAAPSVGAAAAGPRWSDLGEGARVGAERDATGTGRGRGEARGGALWRGGAPVAGESPDRGGWAEEP